MATTPESGLHPKRAILTAVCVFLLLQTLLAGAAAPVSPPTFNLDIPSEDLDRALQSLALASQSKLLYASGLVEGKSSTALTGRFTMEAALQQLLAGTDLTYEVKPTGVIFVQKKSGGDAVTSGPNEHHAAYSEPAPPQSASVNTATPVGLEEIVVTAQKFTSTIQNTPISMSAMSGDQLIAAGISTVEDFSRSLPGLSMRSAGPGMTEYEARGLASNGGASPTVGFYLDEVPLSPPAMSETGKVVIDPDLYDVSRIELLRGPQGTLYGSGSMGGTIKVVTNQPKLDTFEGSFQGTLSGTEGGGLNGGGSVMLNLPFGDKFALRLVASDSYRSGWIDRVVLNPFPADTPLSSSPPYTRGNVLAAPVQTSDRDVNTNYLNSVRASLLFQPTNDLTVVATAFKQHLATGGYDEFDSPPGPKYLTHYEAADVPESVSDTAHIYSLTVTYNLGFAELTSASAYWDRYESQVQDGSESVSLVNGIYPYVSVPFIDSEPSRQFSQEIRLTSSGDQRLRWIAGGFFSDLNSTVFQYSANQSAFGGVANPAGVVYETTDPYHIEQFAMFVDGSYKLTDTLTLSAGLRWYRYSSRESQQSVGVDTESLTLQSPTSLQASNSGYNPRINLSYSPNGDLTTYISAAKGFRPGGVNTVIPPPNIAPFCPAGTPTSFGPDSVWDYEIGEKAKLFDGRVTVNSDFYYIKWTGVQEALLLACGFQYIDNAGNARSFGPELEIRAKLTPEWLLDLSASYTDAKITSPSLALASGIAGSIGSCPTAGNCTVPVLNVPKDAGSLALIYTNQIFKDYQLTARIAANYVGSSHDESFYFVDLPSYTVAGARLGLSRDKWSVDFFVDNLTNKVAEITANNTSFQFNIPGLIRYTTNQPRTFGTQVNYRF